MSDESTIPEPENPDTPCRCGGRRPSSGSGDDELYDEGREVRGVLGIWSQSDLNRLDPATKERIQREGDMLLNAMVQNESVGMLAGMTKKTASGSYLVSTMKMSQNDHTQQPRTNA